MTRRTSGADKTFGVLFGTFWGLLGTFGGPLGRLWTGKKHEGRKKVARRVSGSYEDLWNVFWDALGAASTPLAALWEGFGRPLKAFGEPLGGFGYQKAPIDLYPPEP